MLSVHSVSGVTNGTVALNGNRDGDVHADGELQWASVVWLSGEGRGGTHQPQHRHGRVTVTPVNQPPTTPEYQYLDPFDSVTGEVRGRIVATDIDGNPLSYQVVSGPWSAASFTLDSSTGNFSYIPSQEKREYVTLYPGYDDYDYFNVSVSDGTSSVRTSVSVLVSQLGIGADCVLPTRSGAS